ncbi:hypothetical protein [Streptomyces sp. NPDC047981]|uniref:hypothetical protein n=1 Tax=Streptomyces sp. NPDC047981 TaxID=3154610 RepID=UPI0034125A9F
MTTARLAPGVALVAVPGHGLAVRTPAGEFLRVDTGAVAPEELVNRLTSGGGAGELDHLVAAFEEAGYTTREPSTPADRPAAGTTLAGRTVLALGDPVLTGPLARCVRDLGGELRHTAPGELSDLAGRPRTAVVWCLDGPVPPGLWDAADRLPNGGTAWLRCHREGGQVWVEPPACAPGDVSSADVRLRRLAATPAHRELAAYWEGSRFGDEGPGHDAASAAFTAGLLAADLLAWAEGPDGPRLRTARRRLRRIDLGELTLTAHPVLPVPAVAGAAAPDGRVGARAADGRTVRGAA